MNLLRYGNTIRKSSVICSFLCQKNPRSEQFDLHKAELLLCLLVLIEHKLSQANIDTFRLYFSQWDHTLRRRLWIFSDKILRDQVKPVTSRFFFNVTNKLGFFLTSCLLRVCHISRFNLFVSCLLHSCKFSVQTFPSPFERSFICGCSEGVWIFACLLEHSSVTHHT